MEALDYVGYTEEIPMYELDADQFLAAARETASGLQWWLLAANESGLVFRTPGTDLSQGEYVIVQVAAGNATLQSVPVNEYYWDEAQHRSNAALFREAMATIAIEQHKASRSRNPVHREKYGALLPSKTYIITPIILYSIALVYLVMVLSGISPVTPTAEGLFRWGGSFREAIAGGEWWRLITYMFLHGGIMHLLMNAYALLYIGMFLEPLMGKFRFAAAYLLAGICAGLLSIIMHSNSVGVGASGAIFGLYGVFFALLTTNYLQKTAKKTMMRSILFFIVFNLLMGMQGNVDNAGHIGGLLSGILIGYAYYPGVRNKASVSGQLAATALLTVAVMLLCTFVVGQFKAVV